MNAGARFGILLCALFISGSEPATAIEEFGWLDGAWERPAKELTAVEEWTRVSSDTMEGIVYLTDGNETRITEHLRIERFGERIYYLALPVENEFPTPFELVDRGDASWTFENPDYQFPQRLVYKRTEDGGLTVRIEGTDEGEERGLELQFTRRFIGE
jgi:hypothetical protein